MWGSVGWDGWVEDLLFMIAQLRNVKNTSTEKQNVDEVVERTFPKGRRRVGWGLEMALVNTK